MKNKILFFAITFCVINNAFGSEDDGFGRVVLHSENLEYGTAASIGIYTGDTFYGGLNFSYVRSSTVLQYNNRKTIYPIYFTLGLRAPWKISPYIEAGADLADLIIDEVFDDENNSIDETDYYYSAGLEVSVTEKISFSVYAKKYNFIFDEIFAAKVKNRQKSYGGGLLIRF